MFYIYVLNIIYICVLSHAARVLRMRNSGRTKVVCAQRIDRLRCAYALQAHSARDIIIN